MLRIKFSRIGKKGQPNYRVAVMERGKDTYGSVLENLGTYNPRTKQLDVNNDRVKYWVEKGAQATPTAHNLFVEKKIIEGKKVKAFTAKKKEEGEKK